MRITMRVAAPGTTSLSACDDIYTAVGSESLVVLKELCDVQFAEEAFGPGLASDAQVAAFISGFEGWADMDVPTRESTVNARRATLNTLRA